MRPCAGVTVWIAGQWAGSKCRLVFYLLVGRDMRLRSFLVETTLAGFQDVGAVRLTCVGFLSGVFNATLLSILNTLWRHYESFYFFFKLCNWYNGKQVVGGGRGKSSLILII